MWQDIPALRLCVVHVQKYEPVSSGINWYLRGYRTVQYRSTVVMRYCETYRYEVLGGTKVASTSTSTWSDMTGFYVHHVLLQLFFVFVLTSFGKPVLLYGVLSHTYSTDAVPSLFSHTARADSGICVVRVCCKFLRRCQFLSTRRNTPDRPAMRFANLLLVPALWTLLDPVVIARPQSNDRAAPPAPGLEDPEATPSRTRGEGASLVDPVVWGALLVTVFSIGGTYVIFNKAVARLRKEIDADKKKLRDDLREMDEKRKEDWKRLDEERRDAYTRLGHVHADLGEINRALLTTDFAEFSRQYLKAERCILTELGVFDSVRPAPPSLTFS